MKLKIFITKNILEQSKNCSNTVGGMVGQNCAIGKAIFSLFGAKSWVAGDEIEICKNDITSYHEASRTIPNFFIPLPTAAQIFIDRFDNSSPEERINMEPFSFEIDVPQEVVELVGLNKFMSVTKNNECLALV